MVEVGHVFCSGTENCPVYKLWVEKDKSNRSKTFCVIEKYESMFYSCIASREAGEFVVCERVSMLNKLERVLKELEKRK